ncbi:MAG: type VI secretion system baseplate subunit TssG [candidate division Zixibacteria bacterium]
MIYFGKDKMPDFCHRHHPFHYTTALNLLTRMGIDIDRINLLAVGEYENYKGEVLNQSPSPESDLRKDASITLEIGFLSAVDFMPYQFFYGLEGRFARGNWEQGSRHFMAPFDGAVIRFESKTRYHALKYNFGIVEREYLEKYLALFDFDVKKETGSDSGHSLWAALLPIFNEWAGNAVSVEKILQAVLGYKFKIIENLPREYEIPNDLRYYLGSMTGRLGRELILGKSFTECDSCYGVRVGGIKRDEIKDFLPGKSKRKKLETLLGLCMPSNLEYKLIFQVSDNQTIIGEKDNNAILGYSVQI